MANPFAVPGLDADRRRLSIGFLNLAHGIDHFVMLIFPTVVIGLESVYGRSYAELLALGTASFLAFGVFSLPAGWLADHWSRRNMMALFFHGCGVSLIAASLSPNLVMLAVALFALGVFAAIYHPVGTAMLVAAATNRGRTLALNGVCGNIGVALAAGITALLTATLGWRAAFLVPGLFCLAIGAIYLMLMQDDRAAAKERSKTPEIRLVARVAAIVFGLFVLVWVTAGLVFNIVTIALPKIVDERFGSGISLVAVGGVATALLLCGAIAQFTVGRVLEKFPPHFVFAGVATLQFLGVVWVAVTSGNGLLLALAIAMGAIYGQVVVNDFVIARYTADSSRARVFAVRYFVTYVVSAAAVSIIAFLHSRGGFDAVLAVTAVIALGFVIGTVGIAALVNGVERDSRVAQPAE
jgi:MFS family permease